MTPHNGVHRRDFVASPGRDTETVGKHVGGECSSPLCGPFIEGLALGAWGGGSESEVVVVVIVVVVVAEAEGVDNSRLSKY